MSATRLLLMIGLALVIIGCAALALQQPLVAVVTFWLAATALFVAAWANVPRDHHPNDWRDDDDH